jgi:hypothetical protein
MENFIYLNKEMLICQRNRENELPIVVGII